MNSRKGFTFLSWGSSLLHVCIVGLFVWNLFYFTDFYLEKELDYISEVEHRISDILLNSNTDSSISIKMDELIDQYPMEVVVEKYNDVVYNSVPVLGSINMIGKLNQEAPLIESQGTYNGYDLWFALYHVPNATYMAPFMKKQGVLIALALLVLSFVVILTRRGF